MQLKHLKLKIGTETFSFVNVENSSALAKKDTVLSSLK